MPSFLGAFELSQKLLKNVDFIPDHDTKGSIPVTAKKTSFLQNSYQTLKLGPFSWGMNNHLFVYKIFQSYHVSSLQYFLYEYFSIKPINTQDFRPGLCVRMAPKAFYSTFNDIILI